MSNQSQRVKLDIRKNRQLQRVRRVIHPDGNNIIHMNGQRCLDFTSNDYLGLKKHPVITASTKQAITQYGVGSGASAFVSGYTPAHESVEKRFAEWLGVEKAILFNSGYSANFSIINAVINRTNTVLSDRLCHASLLDGVILSRAKHRRYQHNHVAHAKQLIQRFPPDLIITESVFSMEGDIAPINELSRLAKQSRAMLLIDDAHGIGVLGRNGKGSIEQFNLNANNDTCLVMPLGKAFNAMGAIVAGQADVMETILQQARSYCYSTSLPPALCTAIDTSLTVIQTENWRRQRLHENIRFFISHANKAGLPLATTNDTPIKPILIHDNNKALALQQYLLDHGLFVAAIRPPTVPVNKARLRVSINSLHSQAQLSKLIHFIAMGLAQC